MRGGDIGVDKGVWEGCVEVRGERFYWNMDVVLC